MDGNGIDGDGSKRAAERAIRQSIRRRIAHTVALHNAHDDDAGLCARGAVR
jgi:hypothetical protein